MTEAIVLIVNADDFGLARGVNLGVAEACDRGILRSASLLAGGAFAEDAARVALERPALGVGIHLALTQVRPVLPPSKIPALMSGRDLFPAGPREIVARLIGGKIPQSEILAEFSAQMDKALDLGLRITHLDSHQHLHLLPKVRDAFMEIARKYKIAKMRLPRLGGPVRSYGEWLKAVAIAAHSRLYARTFDGMIYSGKFWGLAASGDMNRERLLSILRALGPGTHELMTHPAAFDQSMHDSWHWDYHWEDELSALTDPNVLALVKSRSITLANFIDL